MAEATIYPDKDSWLDSLSPTVNHGADKTLEIGYWGYFPTPQLKRTLFHYDLSVVPAGATINSALQRDYATQGASFAYDALAQRITQDLWIESQCDWTDYRNDILGAGIPWATPGGDKTTTDQISWNFPTATGSFDITGFKTLCDDAIANRSNQLHFILLRNVETGGGTAAQLIIASGEHADTGRWPALIVDYTPHIITIDGACVVGDQIITVG